MEVTANGLGLDVCYVKLQKGFTLAEDKPIQSPKAAVDAVADFIKDMDREMMCVLTLRTNGIPINASFVSIGTLNTTLTCPREVMKTAILSNAASIILLHNHPSGGVSPSMDDIRVTDRMHQVCDLMGIELLDHIIVGAREWYSFREKRALPQNTHTYLEKLHEIDFHKNISAMNTAEEMSFVAPHRRRGR